MHVYVRKYFEVGWDNSGRNERVDCYAQQGWQDSGTSERMTVGILFCQCVSNGDYVAVREKGKGSGALHSRREDFCGNFILSTRVSRLCMSHFQFPIAM